MAQFLSPDTIINEIDNTGGTQAVSTGAGAFAGVFRWGPIGKIMELSSEAELVLRAGKPSNLNGETFFTAANFLGFTQNLILSRAANTDATLTSNVFPATGGYGAITDNNMIVTNSTNVISGNVASGFNNTAVFNASSGDFVLVQQVTKANTANVISSNFRQITVANTTAVSFDLPLTFNNSNTITNIVVVTKYTGAASAFANVAAVDVPTAHTVRNFDEYDTAAASFDSDVLYIAKYAGNLGNSLRIAVCDTANQFSSNLTISDCAFSVGSLTGNLQFTDVTAANAAWQSLSNGDILSVGNNTIGTQSIQISSIGTQPSGNVVSLTLANKYAQSTDFSGATTINRKWEFNKNVDTAPGQSTFVTASGNVSANDELHVVITDQDGLFTGNPGQVLEVYQGLSRATDAKTLNNSTNYYKTVLNNNSNYVYFATDRSGAASNTAQYITNSTATKPVSLSFVFGNDGAGEGTIDLASLATAYDLFKDKESVVVDCIMQGKARGGTNGEQLANYISDNIVSSRLDCVLYVSPDKDDVVNASKREMDNVVAFGNSVVFNTRLVMDTGYKSQYDRYNDVYRWVPLNADLAGADASTPNPWDSAGNKQVKNCIKLAWKPTKAERDVVYPLGINPVVTFPGEGTVIFGDRTHYTKPSAFSRINTRKVFNFMERTVSAPARAVLFKNNTAHTRAGFVASVTPFFNLIKGQDGIEDFRIIADESNNTSEILQENKFVGDIYIKPVYSVNWVIVNFTATKPGVAFTETIV
jgi:hypothetical protein